MKTVIIILILMSGIQYNIKKNGDTIFLQLVGFLVLLLRY